MELTQGIKELVGKRETRWDPQFLNGYLLSLARDKKWLLPMSHYPDRIGLFKSLDDALETIRFETNQDQHERWTLLGLKKDKKDIYTRLMPVRGTKDSIPHEIQYDSKVSAENISGITKFIGDIHSHPDGFFRKFLKTAAGEHLAFSAQDMYAQVTANSYGSFTPVMD